MPRRLSVAAAGVAALALLAGCGGSPDPTVVTRTQVVVCPAVLPPVPACGEVEGQSETLRDLLIEREELMLIGTCWQEDSRVVREAVRLCRETADAMR